MRDFDPLWNGPDSHDDETGRDRMRHPGTVESCRYCSPPDEVAGPRAWLRELEYRPGWRLRVSPADSRSGLPMLSVHALVADSRGGSGTVEIAAAFPVHPPFWEDRERFLLWLLHLLSDLECHESAEWLRWRGTGRPLFDPHAPDPRRLTAPPVSHSGHGASSDPGRAGGEGRPGSRADPAGS